MIAVSAFAQQSSTLVGNDQKQIKLFFEKVYLQTDRTYYNEGEDIWFSAYLVNGKSTSLTGTSNTLYVELISPKAEILDRKVIRVADGLGYGDFKLKDSIAAGWYSIKAYTNWMRNFDDNFVFQKRIYIDNQLHRTPASMKAGVNKNVPVNSAISLKKTISFYPEGGSLVENVSSLVAFKALDEAGNGIKVHGGVLSSKGDTVTTFQSTDAGVGLFVFTPLAGETYRVATISGKDKMNTELPSALQKGLVMHATTDSAQVKIAISTNDASFAEWKDKAVSVQLKHAGESIYSGSLKFSKASILVTIPTGDMPQGLATLTVLDDLGRPQCERLIFIQGNNGNKLVISTNKAVYKNKEKVTVQVKATNVLGQPIKTFFSFAAVDAALPTSGSNILSYLLLESEIKDEIKNPDQYFDVNNAARFKQLDLLLLTQGWRDYLWKRLAEKQVKISYIPEPGITISGNVRERVANKPLANMNITLFGNGMVGDKIFVTKTDANGRYFLDGLNWIGNQELKLSSKDSKGKKGGYLLLDSLFKNPMKAVALQSGGESELPDQLSVELSRRSSYIRKTAFADSISLNDVNITANKGQRIEMFDQSLTTFGYPDQEFNITSADYSYNGLEHFLLTKVKGAQPLDDLDSTGNEGIAFLSNGKKIRPRIVINNREDLFGRLDYYSLTMDQINKVRVSHLVGNSGEDVYVVYLDVKDTALQGPNVDILNVNLTGYYQQRIFYSPQYDGAPTRNLDVRTTLFWAPALKTGDDGQKIITFFTGDNKGSVKIQAEGITTNGHPVAAKTAYKVQ
ncbi:hypothetical protein [Pedobacter sp. MW01-1-1]|uniref:hypothetical protein n=1 Tax=Pedobacter sp. MW01-1-1 TaxID=3383027 RepID=UPI003FEEDD59